MNLATLAIESVHNFIVTKVIPRIATTWHCQKMESAINSDGVEPAENVGWC